ncbi:hypothetical protein D6D54_07590 [Spiroplasma poulsonii]|uniref:Uncharacterized protein n=1 Tax=Spiroplasma poulsonii TaxID=2138 RepID=A0A433ENK9_9MOLU|nr:hypothetical protein [Spiroplasma poulsonii]MBW3059277.1 hypothetical protein [Spiroplasma poulsonii]MBW3059342.1 hypothetical protein [Spiroplasma poulsonii]MBW3059522.1 hypothetical protein [Spiroplasma poulsonii]MBW3059577.1 hypothetical protein [Spiroplasma poulsonii]RUP75893.1 hypothetical protein D6D54_07590 [Spiroplasma poulsonii]
MAQNPQRIFGDIANQATQKEREAFDQWYLQTYQQKFSWEALFAWKEANKFGLTYKRKKNIKYNEGSGKDGQVFNTDDNLLKYSTVEFEDGIVELDTILTFARKLDPVESDFNPNLWAADIEQAMDTEVAYKRNKILEIINKGTVTTIQGKKADDTNALQIHDEIMDKIYENGFTPSETIVLGSADFIRGIRNKLQLQLGANDQINNVMATSGAMKSVEGTTYYMAPKKLPIINKDGSEGTISLLPDGVNAIAFKFSKKYDPLILRKKDHTPLRVGAAALGTGMGNTLIMERVLYLGGAVVESKGIIKHIVAKIDISGIDKLDKPTIHVTDPTQTTAEQLKPQFKDVVLKSVKAVNNSLTENDYDYFIESKGEDWPIDITNDKTVEVQIEGKNNASGQTNPIDVKIKNS